MDDEWDRYTERDPIEGPDPITTCNGNAHGTHVAGMSPHHVTASC